MSPTNSNQSEVVKNVSEYIDWISDLDNKSLYIFRGHADKKWRVEASACRNFDDTKNNFKYKDYQGSMLNLLSQARTTGVDAITGDKTNDIELLGQLQHHGAATCLIDFTFNPLVALWFACGSNSESSGKAIALPTSNTDKFSIISPKNLEDRIDKFIDAEQIWKWCPPAAKNNRVLAQNSIFILGPREISSNYFKEIEIDRESKSNIKDELSSKYGINDEYLFCDLSGFAVANSKINIIARDSKDDERSAEEYFTLGLKYHQSGYPKQAIVQYNFAITADPSFAGAYNNRGLLKTELDDKDKDGAMKDYNEAIRLNPQFATAYNNRGLLKTELDDKDKDGAMKDYNEAIRLNPQYATAYNNRGLLKAYLGDKEGAMNDYNETIKINPQYADTYFNRGNLKSKSDDKEGAMNDYNETIKINPQHADAYFNRGLLKEESDDKDGAKEDFKKVDELDPQFRRDEN